METPEKIKYITRKVISKEDKWVVDLFTSFNWAFENFWNREIFPNEFNVKVFVLPDKFIQYSDFTSKAEDIMKRIIVNCSSISIRNLSIKPDYALIDVHNTQIEVIQTEWQEINALQKKLINSLNVSLDPIDYQNIGNTSRTIMQKLAQAIFNPTIHYFEDKTIDVSNGKYKNQLQCYLKTELTGKNKKPLRLLAQSALNYTMDSIDLMNATTHKLNAEKHFAESCANSTINIISLIKAISEMNKEDSII